MKTTVVIDDSKLKRVMELTGIRTYRAAIDFALDQAERVAKVARVFEGGFYLSKDGDVVDPHYDVKILRALDRPKSQRLKSGGHAN